MRSTRFDGIQRHHDKTARSSSNTSHKISADRGEIDCECPSVLERKDSNTKSQ